MKDALSSYRGRFAKTCIRCHFMILLFIDCMCTHTINAPIEIITRICDTLTITLKVFEGELLQLFKLAFLLHIFSQLCFCLKDFSKIVASLFLAALFCGH